MDGAGWMHATGITPAIAPGPLRMWQAALERAFADSLPVSLDLNHRPQLGPLDVRPRAAASAIVAATGSHPPPWRRAPPLRCCLPACLPACRPAHVAGDVCAERCPGLRCRGLTWLAGPPLLACRSCGRTCAR
jgi:hypothetical protein